jgi:hypothetical protein
MQECREPTIDVLLLLVATICSSPTATSALTCQSACLRSAHRGRASGPPSGSRLRLPRAEEVAAIAGHSVSPAVPSWIIGEPAATSMRRLPLCVSRSAARDDVQSWWLPVRPHCVSRSWAPNQTLPPTRARVSARQWEWSCRLRGASCFSGDGSSSELTGSLLVEPTGSGAGALPSIGRPACGTEPPQLLLPVATGGAHLPVTDCLLPSGRNQLLIDA